MQLAMGELPQRKQLPVEIQTLGSEDTPSFTRTKTGPYLAELGDSVDAWLLVPKNLRGKAPPAMLCLH
ncbi:MAG: hypothetical protein U0Y68_12105 [Blastocatellia bacterium]